MARELVQGGARVALAARDAEELQRVELKFKEAGAEVHVIVADIQDRRQAERAVEEAAARFAGLDVLVNNAGLIAVGPQESMKDEDYEAALAVHFWGPLHTMRAAVPHLRKSRGRIVNISSLAGKIPVPHTAPYTASKFALAGLSGAFGAELSADGISVTTVFPGLLRTGSHVRAFFKGDQAREFRWFTLGLATPATSMNAARAARQILVACGRRQSHLVVSVQAKLAVAGYALLPRAGAAALALMSRLLPRDNGGGRVAAPGREVRNHLTPAVLTALPDAAIAPMNQG